MAILELDENNGFKFIKLTTDEGKIMMIGDEFDLMPNQRADKDGTLIEAGTKVKIEGITLTNTIVIKGVMRDGESFTGGISSFDLQSRKWIKGIHHGGGCGGNIMRWGPHEKCDKCGTSFRRYTTS